MDSWDLPLGKLSRHRGVWREWRRHRPGRSMETTAECITLDVVALFVARLFRQDSPHVKQQLL